MSPGSAPTAPMAAIFFNDSRKAFASGDFHSGRWQRGEACVAIFQQHVFQGNAEGFDLFGDVFRVHVRR